MQHGACSGFHRVSFTPGMILPDLVSFNHKCTYFEGETKCDGAAISAVCMERS